MLFNWQNEVKKFAPTLKVYEHYGSNRKKSKPNFAAFDLVLTSYGTLLSDIKLFQTYPFDFVVLDESQAIKNPQSMRYKAVCLLNSRNRIVLTGTPIENNTFDLYAQLSFINPGIFGNRTKFRDEYALPIDKFKETKRAKELRSKIHPFLLRRTKQQVARELPEKTEMVLYCEMGVEQRTVYNQFREAIREEMMSVNSEEVFGSKSMLMLKGLTKLRQICNSPATLNEEQDYGASSAKLEVLMEELRARHQSNKILIFSQFVSMLDLIQKELDQEGIQYEKLIGETKNRKEVVANFQENENVRVFLISLKAGGVGLNLTEADYVYLVDPWWNPAVENQAIDRCHRMGQDKKVVAVRLICPDTIEEKIQLLQGTKKDLSHDLIKTDEEIAKKLTREDLLALLD